MTQPNDTTNDTTPSQSPIDRLQVDVLKSQVVAVLKTCYDPEIPVDIYELGLIYAVHVEPTGSVRIEMTLTSPQCPVAETLPAEVRERVGDISGVTEAKVDIVWDPPWTPDRISEAAKLELGLL